MEPNLAEMISGKGEIQIYTNKVDPPLWFSEVNFTRKYIFWTEHYHGTDVRNTEGSGRLLEEHFT